MPPSAPSVTTTGSSSTALSGNVSDNPRSLKNYELIDKDQLTAVVDVLSSIDIKNCDISLVTCPKGFPPEKLSEIENHGYGTHDIELGGDFYTVRDASYINTNVSVPLPRSESRFRCKSIPHSLTLTKSMKNDASCELHFIPRPEFPKMSENLSERFVPFGCQVLPSSNTVESPSKRKKKKHKRKLQNEDETLNQTVQESAKKKRKKKKSDIPQSDESAAHDHGHATNTEHLLEMTKKEAKRARKEAKKAKKKRKKE